MDLPEATESNNNDVTPPPMDTNVFVDSIVKTIVTEPEEENALTVFTEEWYRTLETKRTIELEEENKIKIAAANDLNEWNSQRDMRLASKKDSNRTAEQVFLETLESDIDGVNTWDRVTKLVEASQDAVANDEKADTSRMRKLFIQLKNEPISA